MGGQRAFVLAAFTPRQDKYCLPTNFNLIEKKRHVTKFTRYAAMLQCKKMYR